jgi:hypothetical protein
MALASSLAENAALNGITASALFLAACTGSPGTTTSIANEVTGGTYARQALTWTAASAGSTANVAAVSTPIPATTTVSYFGACSAISGGSNFYIGGSLTASQTFSTAGTLSYAIAAVTLTAS